MDRIILAIKKLGRYYGTCSKLTEVNFQLFVVIQVVGCQISISPYLYGE